MLNTLRYLRHGPLSGLQPIWVALGRIYRWAVTGSGLAVQQRIGPYGPFRLSAQFAFSDFANWGNTHNDGFRACIEACRGKHCVFDIGAHIGLVALPAASVMAEGGYLVAFEPADANRELLQRHVRQNGFDEVVHIEAILIGPDSRSNVLFYEMKGATGMNSIAPGAMGKEYRPATHRQMCLDDYCREHGLRPEIIKIDVEGAELGVLRGAKNILQQCRPQIFLSVHPRQISLLGESVDDLWVLINDLGYDCSSADGMPVKTFELREYILTPRES